MPIDWSPYSAPTPPSPIAQGIRGIGSALDAVLARRQAMEQARLQREAAADRSQMVDTREWARIRTNDENSDRSRDQRGEIAGRTAETREHGQEMREADSEGRELDRAIAAKKEGLPAWQGIYANYERMKRERMTRETQAREAEAEAQKAQSQGQGRPQGQAAAPPQAQPDPGILAEVEAMGPRSEWANPPPMPDAPPAAPPESVAPESVAPPPVAMDVPAAVASRQRPVAPMADDADPLAAVDPRKTTADWVAGQKRLYGSDPEISKAIDSIAVTFGRKYVDPEKLQRAFEARLSDIQQARELRTRQGQHKDEVDERDKNRRMTREAAWSGEVNRFLGNLQYRKMVADDLQQDDLSIIARNASVSAPMATLLQGRWAKWAQGAGVLTDNDLRTFYGSMGDIATRMGVTLEKLWSGKVPDEFRAEIERAMDTLARGAAARHNEVGRRLANHLASFGRSVGDSPEEMDERIGRYLGSYSPKYQKIWTAEKEAERAAAENDAALKAGRRGLAPVKPGASP